MTNEAQFKSMEIILSDDDDNEVYCEPGNGEDLSCLLEGKWLNDKVSYATFVVTLVNCCLCALTDYFWVYITCAQGNT